MKQKIIQVTAVLIGTILLMISAFSGNTVKAKNPEPPAAEPAEHETGETGEGQDEPAPEDRLLSMVDPEAYRTADDLNVRPGAYISVLMREGDSAFSRSFREGAEKACRDLNEQLGYTGSDKVRLNCNDPADDSVAAQTNILDEELALYPDVVAASITDAGACEVQFDLAMENGIYVVGFDASPNYEQVAATVQTDNRTAAVEAAGRLVRAVQDRNNQAVNDDKPRSDRVLIVAHDATSANLAARIKAVRKYLKKHTDYKKTIIYYLSNADAVKAEAAAYYNGDDDPENDVSAEDWDRQDVLRYYFDRYPNLKGVFAADEGSAAAVLRFLSDHEELQHVSVTAFGSTETLQPYLNSGMLNAYVEENAYGMGYATAVAAFRVAAEKGNVEKITVGYELWPEE